MLRRSGVGRRKLHKQALAGGLAGNRRLRAIRVGTSSLAFVNATIRVSEKHESLVVQVNVIEVEKVSAGVVAPAVPDTGVALDRAAAGVDGRPSSTAIISMRNKTVPCALEVCALVIPAGCCAYESYRGALGIACDRCRKNGVLDSLARTNIDRGTPCRALVVAHGYENVIVRRVPARNQSGIGKVNGAVIRDADLRI